MWEFSRIKGLEGRAMKSSKNKKSCAFLCMKISKHKEKTEKFSKMEHFPRFFFITGSSVGHAAEGC